MLKRAVLGLCLPLVAAACGAPAANSSDLVLGVMLPLHGPQASLAQQELNGIEVAVDAANRAGGVHGRRVHLVSRDVTSREGVEPAVRSLKASGAQVVMGTYSSALSIPAAHSTSAAGLVYWETGAVADQVTGEALPRVFRVGAAGSNLGKGSAVFAAEQLAPRLGRTVEQLRVTVVQEHDPYGDSVAAAAVSELRRRGAQVSPVVDYDARKPEWDRVFPAVVAAQPDVLVLASYIPDGVAFRREMLARRVRVGALIGSTMAECGPEFGAMLGDDAIGVFASDRPTRGFNPAALTGEARAAYYTLAADYQRRFHAAPGEEPISGFSSAWALIHHVLPAARSLDPAGIEVAASAIELPDGALPNGAGLRFSHDRADRGQNLRASSVVWQWQGYRKSVTVWPPVLATGAVGLVPLPR
ncbi:MAG: ABC transporter substrate-binding protein [Candidatus Dormibacteraeota bacterium]|nr:ABC transporter substrate-binding protein [Candidatus Dormibacteraeota bacterium]